MQVAAKRLAIHIIPEPLQSKSERKISYKIRFRSQIQSKQHSAVEKWDVNFTNLFFVSLGRGVDTMILIGGNAFHCQFCVEMPFPGLRHVLVGLLASVCRRAVRNRTSNRPSPRFWQYSWAPWHPRLQHLMHFDWRPPTTRSATSARLWSARGDFGQSSERH